MGKNVPRRGHLKALCLSILNLQFAICNLQFLLLFLGSFAFAADPPPSTDDQLRDSLNSKAGDDYDRELLGDPAKPDGKSRVDDPMQKKLQQELGPAAQKEGKEDPLLKVARDMRDVQQRIGQRDSGPVTQHVQRQIVSDLAKLIDEAKKSGSCSGKPSNSRKPTGSGEKKPPNNSTQASGTSPAPAEKSDPKIRKPEAIRAAAKEEAIARMKDLWGAELQGHEREHVLELPGEYFLPEYELEIEDYFRRLSEDQPNVGRP